MVEEDLIAYIATNLVNHPEQVTVNSKKSGRSTILELHVAPEDMGRVIGRNGRVANAMRTLLRAAAPRQSGRVILEID